SSELLKSEQPLRSKDQKQTPWLACDLSGTQIRQEPLSSYRCALSFRVGGGERDRTDDLLLAKQALSQLSYTPDKNLVGLDGFEPSTPALSRRCSNQLSYRPLSGNRGRTVRPRHRRRNAHPEPRIRTIFPVNPLPVALQQPISVSTGTRGRSEKGG